MTGVVLASPTSKLGHFVEYGRTPHDHGQSEVTSSMSWYVRTVQNNRGWYGNGTPQLAWAAREEQLY